jgi:hypothetical protein
MITIIIITITLILMRTIIIITIIRLIAITMIMMIITTIWIIIVIKLIIYIYIFTYIFTKPIVIFLVRLSDCWVHQSGSSQHLGKSWGTAIAGLLEGTPAFWNNLRSGWLSPHLNRHGSKWGTPIDIQWLEGVPYIINHVLVLTMIGYLFFQWLDG